MLSRPLAGALLALATTCAGLPTAAAAAPATIRSLSPAPPRAADAVPAAALGTAGHLAPAVLVIPDRPAGSSPVAAPPLAAPRATMSLTRSRSSYQRGRTGVLLTVAVRGTSARPTGTVTLWAGTMKVARKALPSSGKVSFRLPTWLLPRTHTVKATFTPRDPTRLRAVSRSTTVKVTDRRRVVKDTARSIVSTSGKGSTTNATGADVEGLTVSYLGRIGARNVTVRWDAAPCWKSTRATTDYCAWGYAWTTSTTVVHLGASGDFADAEARRELMFTAAHEYAHLLQNRAFGKGMVDDYQAETWTERQADCAAAVLTGLSVRAHGTYTTTCTGRLAATARVLADGGRPASLGR